MDLPDDADEELKNDAKKPVIRMVAFLHARAASVARSFVVDGASVYTFAIVRHFQPGDDIDTPLVQYLWRRSAMICSQYYSQRTWAIGEVRAVDTDQKRFALKTPLCFQTTVELVELAYANLHEAAADHQNLCIQAPQNP